MWSSAIGSEYEVPIARIPEPATMIAVERGEPVALDRVGDHAVAVGAVGVEDRGGDDRSGEPERADDRSEDPLRSAAGTSTASEQVHSAGGQERERRREREPVDGRGVEREDHLST